MDKAEQEQLNKLRKRVDTANKIRLAFIFIAVVVLLAIYFGNKIYTGTPWYDKFVVKAYAFLTYDIFFMLIAIFAKIGFTVQYNKFVKSHH